MGAGVGEADVAGMGETEGVRVGGMEGVGVGVRRGVGAGKGVVGMDGGAARRGVANIGSVVSANREQRRACAIEATAGSRVAWRWKSGSQI